MQMSYLQSAMMRARKWMSRAAAATALLFALVLPVFADPTIFVQDSYLKFGDTTGYLYIGITVPTGESYDIAALQVTLSIPDNPSFLNFVDAYYDHNGSMYFDPPAPVAPGNYFLDPDSADKSATLPNNVLLTGKTLNDLLNSNFNNVAPLTSPAADPFKAALLADASLNGSGSTTLGPGTYTIGILQYQIPQQHLLGSAPVTINPDPNYTNILLGNGSFLTNTGSAPGGGPAGGLNLQNGTIHLPEASSVLLFTLILAVGLGYGLGRKKPVGMAV